jgi:hypothetical protein
MADKYQRWNDWAPRYIADFMHDFGLPDWAAAAFPGNFAAESGYFNLLQEIKPLVPGSRGGYGHAQWTGPRRLTFERWLARKGWKADSYEGNASYAIRELKGWEPGLDYRHIITKLKAATSLENAVWIVGKYYEGPAKLNTAPREKAAKEALALYRANPVKATVWPDDKEPTMPDTGGKVVVVPPETKVAQPAIGSIVLQGAFGGVVTAFVAMMQAFDSALGWNQTPVFWTAVGGLLSALWVVYGRLSSNAQPVTWTEKGAREVAVERTVAEGSTVSPSTVGGPVVSPVPIATPPLVPQVPAMTDMPAQQVFAELPSLLNGLLGVATIAAPQLAALIKVGQALSQANLTPPTPPPPPRQ